MSNKKKKKAPAKKRMNPQTKAKLFTGLKTIISNESCVEAGRTLPFWIPILITLAAIVLALIPSVVSGLNADMGANALGSNSYGYENGLIAFGDFLEENKATLKLEIKDNQLVETGWTTALEARSAGSQWFSYPLNYNASQKEGEVVLTPGDRIGFEVFINNSDIPDDKFRNVVMTNHNPFTDGERADNPDGTTGDTYRTNVLILSKTEFYFAKFPRNSTGSGAHFVGKYDAPSMQGKNFLEYFKLGEGTQKGTLQEATDIRNNWITFFRESYESTKQSSVWSMAGIMAGVDFGTVVLFGFVIFLMTRGKNNPFRIVKWYEALEMAGWASFSPAVLAIPVGFLLPAYAAFVFLFLYGLRVMWMSMRALRPYEVAGK